MAVRHGAAALGHAIHRADICRCHNRWAHPFRPRGTPRSDVRRENLRVAVVARFPKSGLVLCRGSIDGWGAMPKPKARACLLLQHGHGRAPLGHGTQSVRIHQCTCDGAVVLAHATLAKSCHLLGRCTPSREGLHVKPIIAGWTPFIPQDKLGILTHRRAQRADGKDVTVVSDGTATLQSKSHPGSGGRGARV